MKRRNILITGFASVEALSGWAMARVQIHAVQSTRQPAVRRINNRPMAPTPNNANVPPAPTPTPDAGNNATAPNASPAETPSKYSATGKRDPFRSVIQSHEVTGSDCGAGKKCLVANLVILKGVVKGPDGMLAVVENQHHKSYFLREKDPIFNGQVLRITSDSIVFREKAVDKTGHETTHEVVKRIAGGKPAA